MLETPTMLNMVVSGANYCFDDTTIKPIEFLEVGKMINNTRVVRVFIADTNTNIPVDKRILYEVKEITTDLTDQELFFEIDINNILKKHNKFRSTVLNEDLSDSTGKDIKLKNTKIRDLFMTVVNIASF